MKVCPVCGKNYPDTSTLCSVDAAVLKSNDDPLLGQTLAGKYLIEELIKRGGMGAVYRGRHILMDKTVAVKVLRPSLAVDNEVVARFSREAKAASRISHPHAVNVTDFGESESGVVFLVMEYLDGRTLKEVIKAEGPMSLPRVVEILRQVSGALDAAHEQGVVHRDLKSENIMLSQTNGGDWAKVLDFGIAKIQSPEGSHDSDITAPNLVVGTPQYMSPEQCSQAGPIDARSDVYSLGVITYEMLSGQLPFTGESPTVIMIKHVQDQPPSILASRPDLSAGVAGAIAKALAKDPKERFASAGEFSAAMSKANELSTQPKSPVAETTPIAPVTVPEPDEETVVRPRESSAAVHSRQEIPLPRQAAVERAGAAPFKPWRIMIPAVIVMFVVFGAVYMLTRGAHPTTTTPTGDQAPGTTTGLAADPNSQPVQPMPPPTGDSERDIKSQPASTPVTVGSPETTDTSTPEKEILPANTSGKFGSEPTPSPTPDKNVNQPRESASPKPSPTEKPETSPPKPSPTIRTVTKQTPTPP